MRFRFRPDRSARRSAARWSGLLASVGVGAALSYLLDPAQGPSRRARARDKALKLARLRARGFRRVQHNLSNRAHGLFSRVRARFEREKPDDQVLHERVRSALGRVCSHAGTVEVSVSDGMVRLSGPIAEHEHIRVLRKVGGIHGVRAVRDELSRELEART